MLMPQKLVVVFTPNRQSLTGVLELAQRATKYRKQSDDLRPLVVFPLPSRIEAAEPTLREHWRFGNSEQHISGYQLQFEDLFKEVYALTECNLTAYFDEIQVQHVSRYAYGEEVAALIERSSDRLSLTRSYKSFTERLVNLADPWDQGLPDPWEERNQRHEFTEQALVVNSSQGLRIESERIRERRIFISFKHGVEPDEPIALQIFQALSRHHQVFIDQMMTVGTPWAERIEAEIRQSDFLISLLSAQSVHSEMVLGEIEMAHHLAEEQAGKPIILPIRLNYREPFAYPLSAYLNGINWAFWENAADTSRLLQELIQAIAGNTLSLDTDASKANLIQTASPITIPPPLPAAQLTPLEMPEGTMDTESRFYVERPNDTIALSTIQQTGKGVTITIKGPRQMGKSSLLVRTIDAAVTVGKRVAFLDFQLFDKTALTNPEPFFRQFCAWLTDELEMDSQVDAYWAMPLGNSQRCTRYMQRYLLKELGSPLVLAMDELESVFDTNFRSDFFSMLRSWHNSRATSPIWRQLDLALVTSTEPYQLIENLNQSPFNVGLVIDLTDFTFDQMADLNQRHGSPLNAEQEQQLMCLLHGHPYLVRRALYLTASQQITVAELFGQAIDDRGPFGDHLRYHLFRMHDKKALVQGFMQVIKNNVCQDEQVFFRLRGAGLVRREGQTVLPRCQLYADYFREHLRE
ncbi:toll-Interleukin receptor [Stenomitos frigidus ULC18]|uniref:Toll-Interleukin receptor n=2 Tax=Stenomitos TaxID=1844270 RepID=A0A2T1E9T8_9CYAN|nr:toll-Interleukin receptor [Stenomitos frigidus ULC18]